MKSATPLSAEARRVINLADADAGPTAQQRARLLARLGTEASRPRGTAMKSGLRSLALAVMAAAAGIALWSSAPREESGATLATLSSKPQLTPANAAVLDTAQPDTAQRETLQTDPVRRDTVHDTAQETVLPRAVVEASHAPLVGGRTPSRKPVPTRLNAATASLSSKQTAPAKDGRSEPVAVAVIGLQPVGAGAPLGTDAQRSPGAQAASPSVVALPYTPGLDRHRAMAGIAVAHNSAILVPGRGPCCGARDVDTQRNGPDFEIFYR